MDWSGVVHKVLDVTETISWFLALMFVFAWIAEVMPDPMGLHKKGSDPRTPDQFHLADGNYFLVVVIFFSLLAILCHYLEGRVS